MFPQLVHNKLQKHEAKKNDKHSELVPRGLVLRADVIITPRDGVKTPESASLVWQRAAGSGQSCRWGRPVPGAWFGSEEA